jgi:hypothetical protein
MAGRLGTSEAAPLRGATIGAGGFATILDVPPAPFTPVEPGEPEPPSAEQIAEQDQFSRVSQFQNRVREEVEAVVERLRREEAGNFVSVYYDNEGDPSVVFQFLRDGPGTLRQYSNNPRFFGKTVRFSKEELMAAADFMWATFREDRVLQSTGIGRNEVEARVAVSRDDFLALVRRKGVVIPPSVNLVFGAAPVVPLVARPRPAVADTALPPEIARFVRIFPRDDRVPEALNSIESQVKVVLRDGCFRAPAHDNALVLFPFGASLFVDSEAYLAYGRSEVPGYARVGEAVSFMGSVNEVTTASLINPINEACGPGRIIKVEGLRSAAASNAQRASDDRVNALRHLIEGYGLSRARADAALAFLERRQAAQPQQVGPDGTRFPPVPPSLMANAPPPPVMDPSKCPQGTTLSFGLCRTPEGHIRPLPQWLEDFLRED